ncbi:Speckle-type POZ protein, partial [Trichostrongylus colubriformis]
MSEGPSQRLRSRPRGRGESFSISRGDSSPFGAHRLVRKSATSLLTNECVTNVEPVLLTQRWTVNNFSSLLKLSQPGLCLRSSVFKDPTMPDACWQLCLYPGGKRPENANNVSLFLKMSATSPLKEVVVKAEYRFFFLDEDDEIKFSNVNIGDFHAKPPKGGHSWGLRNIPRQKVQNSIRADHSLVISCTIELLPDAGRIPCRRVEPNALVITDMAEVSRVHMDNELAMFSGGECTPYSDLSVAVGPEEDRVVFAVHKYKLITHSDVFRAMLEHNMEESKTNMIIIEEFSPTAVKIMLIFLYTGSVCPQELELEDASDVMQLAEKYNIPALKTMCEQDLIS